MKNYYQPLSGIETGKAARKMPSEKYRSYPEVELAERTWPDRRITKAPLWCSVDLRDGNQALVNPMDIDRKQKMYDHLVSMGFKEIEVGFPAASLPDFEFCRKLINDGLIPEDVTIQVLTQARPEMIERTFAAIHGVPRAIVHLYNSTSITQRRVVFNTDRRGIIKIAVAGAEKCLTCLREAKEEGWGNGVRFQYSPESYTGTEPDFARKVCEAVMDVWQPSPNYPLILNLPATVEMSTANLYGDMIERFHSDIKKRDSVILSLHPHNDRGTAVAAAEFGIMAGADRVEGTLFGNGERTGNVDIVTLALNLLTQGINPELDISNIDEARRVFEYANQMRISERHPYVGDLVYTAFSGSHQDAIKKGMAALYNVRPGEPLTGDYDIWDVPYLPIDPKHLGRNYEAVVRVNNQSGKGGIAYVMLHEYGLDLPRRLQTDFYGQIQTVTEDSGTEISSYEIYRRFQEAYMSSQGARIELLGHRAITDTLVENQTKVDIRLLIDGSKRELAASGNGPIDALVTALRNAGLFTGKIINYHEHAISTGSDSEAAAYIEIDTGQRDTIWGVGRHESIVSASIQAVVNAVDLMSRSGLLD